MNLTISSTNLLKALMDVSKAIPSKSPLPILENFLFVLKDGRLEITASDSELTLRTAIEVDGPQEEGSIAVPARHMTDLLKELPDQPVGIKTISDSAFECSWASGNSVLPYFPAADYPEIKTTGEDALKVIFPAESLTDGIQGTIYATADDEIRPAMNGIFFDIDLDSTTLVASDSHKLICYTTKDVKATEKASFILHKKPAGVPLSARMWRTWKLPLTVPPPSSPLAPPPWCAAWSWANIPSTGMSFRPTTPTSCK